MHSRFARARVVVMFTCFFIFFNVCSYIGIIDILRQKSFSHFSYPLEADLGPVVRHVRAVWKPGQGSVPLYTDARVHPINRADFPYLIRNHCRCGCPAGRPDIVVLVKSAVDNRYHRDVLRKTWMNARRYAGSAFSVCSVFLLGRPKVADDDPTAAPVVQQVQQRLEEEQRKHGDMVQFDFVDAYYNNTYKTMLGFRWAIDSAPDAKWLFFTDDDYYLNLWNLWRFLSLPVFRERSRLITGFIWDSSMPKRLRFSKWHISVEEYPYVRWPAYPTAGSYVLSMDTAKDLFIGMHYTKYLRFDDVFIGIVAYKLGIPTLHNDSFVGTTLFPIEAKTYRNVIACHMVNNPNRVMQAWKAMTGEDVKKPL